MSGAVLREVSLEDANAEIKHSETDLLIAVDILSLILATCIELS